MQMANVGLSLWRGILARLAGQTHGGNRDLYRSFGYPVEVTIDHLFTQYYRGGIASRIIRSFPKATWRDSPIVRDEKGDSAQKEDKSKKANKNYSPFVEAVEDLLEKKNAISYFERVDRLAGVGEFAILVMGFAGNEKMDAALGTGKRELLFLQPYGQRNITITATDTNTASPRFGLPSMYSVKQAKPVTGAGGALSSFNVHHSRVIHVAEQLDDNEVFGIPRLYAVMNHLMDLEKTLGAGAETYWLNSRQGTAFVADKDTQIDAAVLADMKAQTEEFEHQLRRMLTLQGVTPHTLNAEFHDPGPYLEKLLDVIAGTTGIPKRVLMGSERGELGGDNDESNWASGIDERRESFATPTILRPFVDAMIATENLPRPQGQYWIEWPPSGALSPDKKALVAKTKTESLAAYANSPNAAMIVPPQEFRTDFLEMTPESEYETPEELMPVDENDPEAADQFKEGKEAGKDDAPVREAAE